MQDSVHHSPSDIAREARTLAQSLKEVVKKDEILDKDVEFKRKSLRRQQLKLLLSHPTSKEAREVETHVWMQTSYQFISVYKQRLAVLDRKLFSPVAESSKPIARHGLGEGGHVEYRKTLARFRQFLAEEERFYVQLLIRYQSQFGLTEARAALVRADVLSADQENVAHIESGRSLFPEHADTLPKDDYERQARLATFTKLLVCLGDITRYREQYNDGGGRPRAGHEEGPPRRGGREGRRGHETVARPRNYTRARNIYEQARMLIPDDGNAFHQLAVLSSYQKDTFGSLLNYYRALCVRQPYDTASDNLNTVLKKTLDQYRSSKGSAADDPLAIQKARVDRFLELIVVLHGFWYLDSDERATRASKHSRSVTTRFRSLIAEPALPANTVSEVLIFAFSALWKVRMVNDENVRAKRTIIEPLIAMHVLSLSRALLDTARVQLSVQIEDVQDKADLAQQITRVFRRILPAMRILSKWLRTKMKYLVQLAISDSSPGFLKNAIKAFWESYSSFLTALGETFPFAKLPALKRPLDEDTDLQGFSPIGKDMFVQRALTQNGDAVEQEVHPNEEYLMRISDLLLDAQQIAAIEASPICLVNSRFNVAGEQRGDMPSPPPPVSAEVDTARAQPMQGPDQKEGQASDNEDDGNTEQTSRTGTEDDIVREAFREALRDDVRTDTELEEDEDERIVWSPPRTVLSPLQKIIRPPQMSPQVFPSMQSPKTATASPTRPLPPPALQQPSGTTAQDLLNNVLGLTRSKSEHSMLGQQRGVSPAPQTSLLFGNGTFDSPTKSIWGNGHLGVTAPLPPSVPQYGMGNTALGHERVRSQSFSISQAPLAQPSLNTKDSIYGSMGHVSAALPNEPLSGSGNSGRFGGHHHSLSFSESQSAFQNMPIHSQSQIYYDSHHCQLPPSAPPPAQIQNSRLQGYAGQGNNALPVPDPFVFYETRGMNAIPDVRSSPAVNQSIWGT